MSLSKAERLENIDQALLAILGELGDRPISTAWFNPSGPTFVRFPRTTWDDLADKSLVKPAQDPRHYVLTGGGLAAALKLRGDVDIPEKLGRLCAAFKRRVKGRHADAFVAPQDIEEEIGISRYWISNAVDAGLIERHFRQRGVRWYRRTLLIRVPAAFGHELL
jgi:hypothetical protein